MPTNVLIPVGQLVALPAEYGLHRITQHADRKRRGGVIDDGVLQSRAVLIFIHNQATEISGENILDVAFFK